MNVGLAMNKSLLLVVQSKPSLESGVWRIKEVICKLRSGKES